MGLLLARACVKLRRVIADVGKSLYLTMPQWIGKIIVTSDGVDLTGHGGERKEERKEALTRHMHSSVKPRPYTVKPRPYTGMEMACGP